MHRCDACVSHTLVALAALALLCVLSVTAAAADVMPVRFEGRVLWIAGTTLMIATDDSQSINVDLTHVPLDEYLRLQGNDYVVVVGTIPAERNRIVATSIEPLEP
jgi:type 1 fimbria pilin